MERAAGYVRVSAAEQLDGHSLAHQEKRIREYCEARGLDLVAIYVDPGISAGRPLERRPGGQQLLEAVAARGGERVQHVVAARLDRLFRSASDCLTVVEEWQRRGVHLHLLDLSLDTSTPAGKLMLTMLAAVAELERAMTAERTRSVIHHLRAARRPYSQPPYGWRVEGKRLVPVPEEQAVIQRIIALRKEGVSYKEIARILTSEGVPTQRGGRWHHWTVSKIVRLNPATVGQGV